MRGVRALRHHDHERPAFGMTADRLGEAELCLPHALGAAFAPAMQEEDDGPVFSVVAPPLVRQVDLETVRRPVEHNAPVQETCILRRLRLGRVRLGCSYIGSHWPACAGQPRQAAQMRSKRDIVSFIIVIPGGLVRSF